ncbi:MAG TPA: NTP transferase domain-containing protein [Allosphingosinicella sp.]|nr:NTP transferase domain-containing protein [Allosphingosinicella sp.]
MQCLIIAAGLGSRLRSRAASKPLAQVAGRPLIEHIVRRARAGGASRFVIVTGYSPEPIEAFAAELAAREGLEIETVRNEEWERPNGLSVLAAAPKLERRFLLLMSDHLFDPEMLAGLIAADAKAALTLGVDYRTDNPLIDLDDATKVAADEEGRIVRLGKTLEDYNCIDTGLFRAGPALIEAIQHAVAHGGAGSLSEGVQVLADQSEARVHDIGARWWLDVDDPRALALAQEALGGANGLI